jgi:MOSC domain-containing protein YiiM
MAAIKSIVYKPTSLKDQPGQVGYTRVPLTEANLVANYGIEGDRKGGHPKRQLNVMDDVTLAELSREGYPTDAGDLGENIILTGIDLRSLKRGTHLQLGADAVIEIVEPRVPCEQLTAIDERMPESVENRVGMICRVLQTGKIRVGDPVSVLVVA